MKLQIPRITRTLYLTDYAPEFVNGNGEPITFQVWVNPPRAKIREYDGLITRHGEAREKIATAEGQEERGQAARVLVDVSNEILAWYVELWSQHPDPDSHWTLEEMQEMNQNAIETDPGLYVWLGNQSWKMINEHRAAEKKS